MRVHRGFRWFNVAEPPDPGTLGTYHGRLADNRIVHLSEDRRHVTFLGNLPQGAQFVEPPSNVEETFLILEGTIHCTLDDGETIVWTKGDLVYWPYDREMQLEYSENLSCLCFFWSDEPLPESFTGDHA